MPICYEMKLYRFDLSFPVRLCLKIPAQPVISALSVLPAPSVIFAPSVIPAQPDIPAHPVIPAKAGTSSTHRPAPRDSHLSGTDGMNENENKKLALNRQEFSNQIGIKKTGERYEF